MKDELYYDKTELMVMLQILRDHAYETFVDDMEHMSVVVDDVKLDSYIWVLDTAIQYINSNCKRRKKEREVKLHGKT